MSDEQEIQLGFFLKLIELPIGVRKGVLVLVGRSARRVRSRIGDFASGGFRSDFILQK